MSLEKHGGRAAVLANQTMIGVAGTIASQWEKFTGWLVAGLGAALALIVANLDKTKDMLPASTASQAIKIFVVILMVHTLQKVLSIAVASAAASEEKQVLAKLDPPLTAEEAAGVLDHVEDAYFFPFSCMISDAFRRIRRGELVHVGRRIIRLALVSTVLAGAQVCLAVWLVWGIARGLP
ncbi:MAG: hypothetical protein EOO27_01670 [Comamonadaceae bacterium]|nr:MAG: hypothetical protein EOO27_01670 [Comamonadaceae bacterium]